jgi:circadian clock protein KaiB
MGKLLSRSLGLNAKSLKKQSQKTVEAFEAAIEASSVSPEYILRLYVTGSSPRSLKAVQNLKKICDEHLPDGYDLEVIDVGKNPTAARHEQIIAIPTLVKKLPEPLRRFVGDLSNTEKVLLGLDLYRRQKPKVN